MSDSYRQLLLPFPQQAHFSPADFLPDASNQAALAWLAATPDWPEHRLLLWGEAGCGKTHLLHLWAAEQGAAVLAGPALNEVPALPPQGLAVDDADLLRDEAILLHLLNLARERRLPVLLAAREPPARWTLRLPDLASRLRATTAVEVAPAEPALLRALLMHLLAEQQLRLDQRLQDWLLLHLPRSAGALREAVHRLDRAALHRGEKITRALAAAVLADLAFDDDCMAAPLRAPNEGEFL